MSGRGGRKRLMRSDGLRGARRERVLGWGIAGGWELVCFGWFVDIGAIVDFSGLSFDGRRAWGYCEPCRCHF